MMPQRIVLVDDDVPMRELFAKLLSQRGYKVSQAGNGRIALEQMQQMPVELVITDMIMPEMDGVEIIVALRRIYPGVKIIAVAESGLGPAENSLNIARALGAHKTLVKPLDPEQLISAVQEVLG
jgi:CheY-like chemotaxis protein